MSQLSSIEWTETTWNPTTGCTKISQGCKYCYAHRMSRRLKLMGLEKYKNEFNVAWHPTTLNQPFKWKKPKLIFVNSMSDLFHKTIPVDFIQSVFNVMNKNPQHTFQVLTKRPYRAMQMSGSLQWSPNIWLGTSIENVRYLNRMDVLKQTNARIKFLSLEPLLGPLPDIDLNGVDWVIVGGESGPQARQMDADWVRAIRNNCMESKTAFFFKQWGGVFKKKAGRMLDDRTWDQMPVKGRLHA